MSQDTNKHHDKAHDQKEKFVVAHIAGNSEEAMVIRGLLESAGIPSPGSQSFDPFPLSEPIEGNHGVEVFVPESQADEARRLLADYIKGNAAAAASDE